MAPTGYGRAGNRPGPGLTCCSLAVMELRGSPGPG